MAIRPQRSGEKIAFHSYRDGNPEIYVMSDKGTNQKNLTKNAMSDSEPNWGPKPS